MKEARAGRAQFADVTVQVSLNMQICDVLVATVIVEASSQDDAWASTRATPQIKNLIGWERKNKRATRAARTYEEFRAFQ